MQKKKIVKALFWVVVFLVMVTKIDSKPGSYSIVEPDWNNTKTLTYGYLKTLARRRENFGVFPDEIASSLNGAAVELSGAIMPIDDVPPDGEINSFWLVNPRAMMGGCAFCNPPALHDMVYVETARGHNPLKIDVERLYGDIVKAKIKGRFFLGPDSKDGMTYLFRIVRI